MSLADLGVSLGRTIVQQSLPVHIDCTLHTLHNLHSGLPICSLNVLLFCGPSVSGEWLSLPHSQSLHYRIHTVARLESPNSRPFDLVPIQRPMLVVTLAAGRQALEQGCL